jgi:hypothetical protein
MPDFRRGSAAIAAAQENTGGSFRPFVPEIYWDNPQKKKDSPYTERYLLFLNSVEEAVTADFINMIPTPNGKGFERVIARTDPSIDEAVDPMKRDWGFEPKVNEIAVAVVLNPVFEEDSRGRKKPVSFEVETNTFNRRIRAENGDLTEDTEEVEAPVVGFVTQSPYNFYNLIDSVDANDGPIEETPVRINRVDGKTYTVKDLDLPVDLTGLIECADGISYLGDDLEAVLDEVDNAETDEDAARIIGVAMLDKRLAELIDRDRYDEIYETISEPAKKFGSDNSSKSKTSKPRRERPARRSQRRETSNEAEGTESGSETAAEPEAGTPEEEKPARRTRTRAAKTKTSEEGPAKTGNPKIEALREKAAKAKAAKAARA